MSEAGEVVFDYGILRCDSVEGVLSGEGSPLTFRELIEAAAADGRVLLQARGGSGKTRTLERLGVQARSMNISVAHLDALAWAGAQHDRELVAPRSVIVAAGAAMPLADLASGTPFLLLVDGLNEIGQSYAGGLLAALDQLAAMYPNLSVVVSDRLVRRRVDAESWILATLSLVSEEQVLSLTASSGRVTGDVRGLRLPYYLNRAIAEGDGSRSDQHRRYLLTHGGVSGDRELKVLAEAAFEQYRSQKSRTLNLEHLEQRIGKDALVSLVGAGAIKVDPTPRFDHHLLHDYLAAAHLAASPELWTSDGLDVLTFKASSMDALAMVLELAPDAADILVRKVYDWNFYGAAYLIAEDRQGAGEISDAMEFAVVTMLGERRFDQFSSTARQVTDALQILGTGYSKTVLSVASKEDLRSLVAGMADKFLTSSEWLLPWADLYTRASVEPVTLSDIEVLRGEDSLLGWTMSNVMRRLRLDDELARSLCSIASDDTSAVVRWRAVHVLGSVARTESVDALLSRVDNDAAIWVRYGSIRSLVEIALASGDLRSWVVEQLSKRAGVLLSEPQLAREVERVLVVDLPPAGWASDITPLIEELWARSESVQEQDRWRSLGASVRRSGKEDQ